MNRQETTLKSSGSRGEETDLRQELEFLRAENAYLKKLKVLVKARIVRERGNEHKPYFDRRLLSAVEVWSLSVVEMLNNRPRTKTATQAFRFV
jgi:hypothetical protein